MKVVELFKRASLKVLVDCWADYVSADDANQGNKARLKISNISYPYYSLIDHII